MTRPAHFVSIDNEQFVLEAEAIVERLQSRGVPIRILGALAVYVHSLDNTECAKLHVALQRNGEGMPMFTDLDLIAYKKQGKEVSKGLQNLGFKANSMVNWWFGDRMMVYEHPEKKLHVDVFFNKLEYSHDITFGAKPGSGRLEFDYPTITLADLVLEKLQPHQMGRKDALDLIVLFLGHKLSEQNNKDTIDGDYIGKVLSDDWGFWYDVTTNMDKVKNLARELVGQNRLVAEQCETVIGRSDELSVIMESAPKTERWNARAKIGSSKPWFRPVEDLMPT